MNKPGLEDYAAVPFKVGCALLFCVLIAPFALIGWLLVKMFPSLSKTCD